MPLKLGPETLTPVTCARVRMRIVDERGTAEEGWGETPLSVQWVWPTTLPYKARHEALKRFCRILAEKWMAESEGGHPMQVGTRFQEHELRQASAQFDD